MPSVDRGLVREYRVEFKWFPGFAVAQKQRSIASLHESAVEKLGLTRILEISTRSLHPIGVKLSAFNLLLEVDGERFPVLLEAAFQGSKVFASQGPFTHLYRLADGRKVKRFMKELPDDRLVGFRFSGHDWPLLPRTAFYDWLYLNSLRRLVHEHGEVEDSLRNFDAFTDIEFNPGQSFSCQARSCALYLALDQSGTLADALSDPDAFIELLTAHGYGVELGEGRLL